MRFHSRLALRGVWILAVSVVAVPAIAYGAVLAGGSGRVAKRPPITFFVSTSGSDSNACSRVKPCASFGRAYQVALPGDLVVVGAGSYGKQTVTWPNAKGAGSRCRWGAPFPGGVVSQDLSGCVTFQPASAGSVTLAGLSVSAPFVRVDGFTITGGVTYGWDGNAAGGNCDQQLAHDEVLSNDSLGVFNLSGVQQVYLVGDSVGPTTDASNNIEPCDPASINNQGAYVNTDHVAVIGSTIHDVTTSNPSGHIEGIHWQDTSYGYVGTSRFLNNDQQDISFHPRDGNDHLDHFLLENNVFAAPCDPSGCSGGRPVGTITWGCKPGTLTGVIVRFNSYLGTDAIDGLWGDGCSEISSYGNILGGPNSETACRNLSRRFNYSYNIFVGGTGCGTGNATVDDYSAIYEAPSGPTWNFSLRRKAPAIGFVPVRLPAPPKDLAGQDRPLRVSRDAGANQWDPVAIVLGRAIGSIRIGEAAADVVAFYGPPRLQSVKIGDAKLKRLTFRLHAGSLWALVDRSSVVGVGTTSPYYTTTAGVGVGASVAPVQAWRGLRWIKCRQVYERDFGAVGVYVATERGGAGKRISSVAMVRHQYPYGRCPQ